MRSEGIYALEPIATDSVTKRQFITSIREDSLRCMGFIACFFPTFPSPRVARNILLRLPWPSLRVALTLTVAGQSAARASSVTRAASTDLKRNMMGWGVWLKRTVCYNWRERDSNGQGAA